MGRKKKIVYTIGLILITLTSYHFLWGRLFPLSPIIIGFEQKEFNKAIIYYRDGIDITKLFIIDKLINEVEDFHQLKFEKKVKIFIFNSDKEYKRRTGYKTRFVCFPPHGAIFVSGKAKKEFEKGKIHLLVYLKHELSHSLLEQNIHFYHSYLYYPGWLAEGIAAYSSHQMGIDGYYTREETFAKIRQGYFFNPDDWGTLGKRKRSVFEFQMSNKYWFIYSEFACLVDDLIQNYGKDKLVRYITELLREKDDKKVFLRVFGIQFNEYVDDFKNRIGYNSELKNYPETSDIKKGG